MSKKDLAKLRKEIDRIDDAIHDLLMERAQVVENVRTAKGDEGIKLRPGREAEVLRRLIGRHEGSFPKAAIVRIWREVMSAYLKMQGHLSMAVYMPEAGAAFWDLARDQYGSQTPMTAHASVRGVIGAVQSLEAAIGVLPVPHFSDEDPWWRHLYSNTDNVPHILSRLPVAQSEKVRGRYAEALVIGLPAHDHTDKERYFTVLETDQEMSPRQVMGLFEGEGADVQIQGQWHDEALRDQWLFLLEAECVLDASNEIGQKLLDNGSAPVKGLKKIGAYALPFGSDELG